MLPFPVSTYGMAPERDGGALLPVRRLDAARDAVRHLAAALDLLRPIDDDLYWDLAASVCDAADNLAALVGTIPEGVALDDGALAPHRRAVTALRPRLRPLGPSATASKLDMVALARNLLTVPTAAAQ